MPKIEIKKIKIPATRKRSLDGGAVRRLMESIKVMGLLNPVTVGKDLTLLAGLHRLEACRHLGHKRIEARVLSLDRIQSELAQVDENLVRNELSPLEQGEHLLLRDELLEKLGMRAPPRRPRKGERSSPFQTTAKIAARLGLSERVAQKRKQVAKILPKRVRDAVRGTPIASSPIELLRLARVEPAKRLLVVRELARGKARTRWPRNSQ